MKNTKRVLVMMLLMTLVVSLFAGCGNKDAATSPDGEKPSTEVPGDGATDEGEGTDDTASTGPKVLRLATTSADTFNPHASSNTETNELIAYIYSAPLTLIANEAGDGVEFYPDQLAELPSTEDNLKWTLKFRDNLQFIDGKAYNAYDFEYSWKMLLDQKLANYSAFLLFDNVPVLNAKEYFTGDAAWEDVGIKVVDEYTIEMTLTTPMPEIDVYTMLSSSSLTALDKEMYEANMDPERTETTYGTTLDKINSNGAYKLTQWIKDQSRTFEKVEGHQMADIFVPDTIESLVVLENATKVQMFEAGDVDSVSVSGEDYTRYAEDPRLSFQERNTIWGFYINGASEKNPVLQDKDFRKALFYATNRELMGKGIFKTFPSTPYFISSICQVGDPDSGEKYRKTPEAQAIVAANDGFDVEVAKEYFDKAYEKNGNKKITLEITYFEGADTMKRIGEVAKEEYEKAFGSDRLEVVLRAMPAMAAYDAYYAGDFELGIGARSQNAFNPWSSMKVWTSDFPEKAEAFRNEEFDTLYERTTKGDLLFDAEGRLNALVEMEKLLLEEVPMIPIFQNDNAVLHQERIYLKTNGAYLPGVGFAILQADIID